MTLLDMPEPIAARILESPEQTARAVRLLADTFAPAPAAPNAPAPSPHSPPDFYATLTPEEAAEQEQTIRLTLQKKQRTRQAVRARQAGRVGTVRVRLSKLCIRSPKSLFWAA